MLRLTPGLGKSICLRWALQAMSWTAHNSTLGIAGGRSRHTAVPDAAGSIWVFGGYNGTTSLDDLWKCDLAAAEAGFREPCRHVRYLCVARRAAWRPRIARSCRVANLGLLHDRLTVPSLMFSGGLDSMVFFEDLWSFDLQAGCFCSALDSCKLCSADSSQALF